MRQTFNNVQSLTNPYGNLPGGVSPFPYSYNPSSPRFITPASLFGIAHDFQWPYTYQLNFSVQRQVKDINITAAYVGALSHHLPFAVDINYPSYNSAATSTNVNNRRAIDTGTLGSILMMQSNMNANYNGLELTAEKRMGKHVGFKGFYTFSKSIDGAQLQNNTTQGLAQDFNNLALERGRADFDARHMFVTSVIWNMDYFSKSQPVLRAIVNGWALAGIVNFHSGYPFTVTSGKDNNLDGSNNDRPDTVGNPYLDPHRPRSQVVAEWFNPAAFIANPPGTDGTAGRNILDGPGYRNVDLSLTRTFTFSERIRLQARAEGSNAFNLVSLTLPSTALATTSNLNAGILSSALVGQVRNAADMRQVQLGLRLLF